MTELERIDRALSAQLDILRHSAHVEASIMQLLEQMRKELIQKLASADLTNWSKARLNRLLSDSEALIASYYTTAQTTLAPTYNVVAGVAASQAVPPAGTALPIVEKWFEGIDAVRDIGFKSKDKLVRMKISDFLAMAESLDNPSSLKAGRVAQILDQGAKFSDVPYLYFTSDGVTAKTMGHEGRHRALALQRMGYTEMPVLLKGDIRWSEQQDPGRFDYKQIPTRLRGQSGNEIDFPATRATAGQSYLAASAAVVPAPITSIPSRTVLESIASNVLIDGATTKTWWSKIAADTAFKFKAAVRQGLMQGETQAQIFKRVNAVVGLAGRNSVALVHTSIMQTMNDAAEATLQKNADVTPTVRHLATLDSSTCVVCGSRDGLEWDTLTKEPVGHDLPYITPPLHFGCRCKLVGVTKLSKLVDGQRASMFGPVDRKVTFNDFLNRQSPAFQNEVLGKGRAALYRSGKLTLRDLVSGTGAPLPLARLELKYL